MLAAAGVNVSYASQMMKLQTNGAGSDLGASLERSLTILERASADVRSISHSLGTISLKDHGVVAALGELFGNLDPHLRIGFDTTYSNGGMARRNIASRVAVMNGRVDYDVSPGHGTTVMVTVNHPG